LDHGYAPQELSSRKGYLLAYFKYKFDPIRGDTSIPWGEGIFFCDNEMDYEGEWWDCEYTQKKISFEKTENSEFPMSLFLPIALLLAFIGIDQYVKRN